MYCAFLNTFEGIFKSTSGVPHFVKSQQPISANQCNRHWHTEDQNFNINDWTNSQRIQKLGWAAGRGVGRGKKHENCNSRKVTIFFFTYFLGRMWRASLLHSGSAGSVNKTHGEWPFGKQANKHTAKVCDWNVKKEMHIPKYTVQRHTYILKANYCLKLHNEHFKFLASFSKYKMFLFSLMKFWHRRLKP